MTCCRKIKQRQRVVLAPWEGSVTWHGDVVASVGGGAAPGRGKGGDDASWSDTNLIVPKNKKNSRDRFSYYKWTVNI
jgi:hypothetical protein